MSRCEEVSKLAKFIWEKLFFLAIIKDQILFIVTVEILKFGFHCILIPKNNSWQIIKQTSALKSKLIQQSDSEFHFKSTSSPPPQKSCWMTQAVKNGHQW